MKIYIIRGEPVALARARVAHHRVYDSQKQLKLLWGLELRKQHSNDPVLQGPIFLDVIFYMPIPGSYSNKKRVQLNNQWFIFKPDSSNLLKMIEDIAQEICYKDDCTISKISVEKVYDDGNGPRTEFILTELKEKREPRKFQ